MKTFYGLILSVMLLWSMSTEVYAQRYSAMGDVRTSAQVENQLKEHLLQMQMEVLGKNKSTSDYALKVKAMLENKLQQNVSSQAKGLAEADNAIEKLDSIVYYQKQRIIYTYDLYKMLITSVKIDKWNDEKKEFVPYSEDTYEYDDNNTVTKLFTLQNIGTTSQSGSGCVIERGKNKDYTATSYYWNNKKEEWLKGKKDIAKFDENGNNTLSERWYGDENGNLYPQSRNEYEYYEGKKDENGNSIVKKHIESNGMPGDTEPTPQYKYEYGSNGQKIYSQWVGSEWLTTHESYFKEDPTTFYTNEYKIINGQQRLSRTTKERRYGFGSFSNMTNIREKESCIYDTSTGKIISGSKEEHLHDWSSPVIDIYYNWNNQKEQWEAYEKTIRINWNDEYKYYLSNGELVCDKTIPEGATIKIIEYGGDISERIQQYINGKWVDIEFSGSEDIYIKDAYSYPVSVGRKRGWGYKYNPATGSYESYNEAIYTYDKDYRIIEEDYYNSPNSKPNEHAEYSYNNEGNVSEYRFYSLNGTTKSLKYKEVYEYDPNVLYSQTLGELGITNYNAADGYYLIPNYTYSKEVSGHKLISIKRYDGNGKLLYTKQGNYFSPINVTTAIKSSENNLQDEFSTKAKMYNLQGVPVNNPKPGQIVVTNQNKKFVIAK